MISQPFSNIICENNETVYRLHANCPHLTELNLSYKSLDMNDIKLLTQLLKKNTHVESLNLEGNKYNVTYSSFYLRNRTPMCAIPNDTTIFEENISPAFISAPSIDNVTCADNTLKKIPIMIIHLLCV